jgi:hypothetical protein
MLRFGVGILCLVGGLAAARNASAAEHAGTGLSLRLRAAVAFPGGKVDDEHDLEETYTLLVPVEAEALYRVVPRLLVGLRGSLGLLVIAGEACAPPLECSGIDYRFGAVAEYRFDLEGSFRKWASLGVGYEIARATIQRDSHSASRVDSGPEYLLAQVGGDFAMGSNFAMGPFLGVSVGEFRSATLHQGDGSETTYSIEDSKLHEWIFIGVRAVWSP